LQIGSQRRDDVCRPRLRSRVAVCLHGNRHQTEAGNQTKRTDAQGESQLDKGKSVRKSLFHFR
jgi:hypothetical protein